jgi:hypothetical protein
LYQDRRIRLVKLPAHRAAFPGKVISFYIVPLDPAYKAGLAGHIPVNVFFAIILYLKYPTQNISVNDGHQILLIHSRRFDMNLIRRR